MKSLVIAFFALAASAQASETTINLTCTGSNLILDQVKTITWTRDAINLTGTMNGAPYSVDGSFTKYYSGNGYGYSTVYGEVIVPAELINGARKEAKVQLSNEDYRNETVLCSVE